MSINEMIKNVKALNIPGLNVNLAMTVSELKEAVRNVMYERFVSTVAAYSEFCGIYDDPKEFAVDFIKNNDYVEKCLRVTINLVLNGGFSNMWTLRGFVHRLLWSHVVEACHEELANSVTYYDDDDDDDDDDVYDTYGYAFDDDYVCDDE